MLQKRSRLEKSREHIDNPTTFNDIDCKLFIEFQVIGVPAYKFHEHWVSVVHKLEIKVFLHRGNPTKSLLLVLHTTLMIVLYTGIAAHSKLTVLEPKKKKERKERTIVFARYQLRETGGDLVLDVVKADSKISRQGCSNNRNVVRIKTNLRSDHIVRLGCLQKGSDR